MMSELEHARFKRWLLASSANTQAYVDAEHLWDVVGCSLGEGRARRVRRTRQTMIAFATAASVAMMAVFVMLRGLDDTAATPWQTEIGEIRSVVLDDGSRITVNTASEVVATDQPDVRGYRVEGGEAFFEVVPGERPFVVSTTWGDAIAIGTAFSVRSDSNGMVVSVAEGVVQVVAPHTSTRLMVNEQAHVHGSSLEQRDVNAEVLHAWRDGSLVFEDARLDEVLERISRYSERRIAIGDDSLAQLRVTAVLTIGHSDDMLDALGQSLDLKWKAVSDRLILVTGG